MINNIPYSSEKISYEDAGFFNSLIRDYLNEKDSVAPLYEYEVSKEGFAAAIENRRDVAIDRELLVSVLERQYKNLKSAPKVEENIALLKAENTFTVITAHQPNLFLGPLYFIHKIVSCINLSKQLKSDFPDDNFVPVFWLGSEDHDFEELNHFHLFGKTLRWEDEQKGAIGRYQTASLEGIIVSLKEILGNSENALEIVQIIEQAYLGAANISEGIIRLLHHLFADYGLVIIDQDDAELKSAFIPQIKQEIFENTIANSIQNHIDYLNEQSYKVQANPRAINVFYLADNLRERIVLNEENNQYEVLNTDLAFSRAELEKEIDHHPERFSPNVFLRGLYQEQVLPNLAYIGGGGESSYWLELKDVFEAFKLPFPIIMLRNSVAYIDQNSAKKRAKLGLSLQDMFSPLDHFINAFVKRQSTHELNLSEEKEQLKELFAKVAQKMKEVEPNLEKSAMAELSKQIKSMEQLESKALKAEKRKQEQSLQQIRNVNAKLYPNGKLQERYSNFMELYVKYGSAFIDVLLAELDPFDKNLCVISFE